MKKIKITRNKIIMSAIIAMAAGWIAHVTVNTITLIPVFARLVMTVFHS